MRRANLLRQLLPAVMLATLSAMPTLVQAAEPDWQALEAEILQRFQAMLRIDTSNPPGNETALATHMADLLRSEGIEVELFSKDPQRANMVARLKGNGSKRPLLLMSHLDVVTVDPAKWTFPPFGATLDNGWVYGRGAIDDKDNMIASLMTMLLLKRSGVELDRDVIFLAEAAEEGGGDEFGIGLVANEHFDAINAEFCLAEGASVTRANGKALYAGVQAGEKKRRTAILTANGISGHGSVPTRANPVVLVSKAVAAIAEWQSPLQLSDATTAFLSRLAAVSPPADAARYRALLNPNSPAAQEAMNYLLESEPATAA
ncbi:MAG: M20/M25/M40 family metallo-hydrolase, partial [Pseudomonadota bacterium]